MLEKSEDKVSGAVVGRLSCGSFRVSAALGAHRVDFSLRVVSSEFFAARDRGILGVYACCFLVFEVREVFCVNGAGFWVRGVGGCGVW
jgi:hypothetical protein